MKPRSQSLGLCAAMLAIVATLGSASAQGLAPLIPSGSLSAFPTIVQAGTHPTLTWDVVLPERVSDIVDIEPPGTIVPKRCLIMDVRILGASVKKVWLDSRGRVTRWEWVPTEARLNYDGEGYSRIFYNTHDRVNPNTIVRTLAVEAGSTIDFGGRFNNDGAWSNFFSSTNSGHNVVALKDGDIPPTTTPLYQQPTIESFLLPYLDDEGRIALGPRDVIYLMELTHTDRYHGGFDLQDLVILLTFYDEVSHNGVTSDCAGTEEDDGTMGGGGSGSSNGNGNGNNGHGNNADGVDSSNPGNAPFTDSDPDVDDEKGRGRRRK